MNKNKAILSCSIISLMLSQTSVLANEAPDENEVEKEETVYALLDADGSVQENIISGHLHKDNGINQISETLDLENIENLKGTQTPKADQKTYTWNTKESDVYYQGTNKKQLPIKVDISYFLNGKKYKPNDLAGKSGKLEMRITFQNTVGKQMNIQGVNTTIHPLYLAAGMIDLNNDHFRNVKCENAKIFTDGNQQIISFITLPGFQDTLKSAGIKQADALPITDTYVIYADTEQFEMNPIMIAMTPEVPLDQLKDINSLSDLTNGMNKLAKSGLQLSEGTRQLSNASDLFAAKMNELKDKTNPLATGIDQLNNGIKQLYSGSQEISTNTKALSDGLAQIKNGAQKLSEGTAALPKLNEGITQLQQGASQLHEAIQSLEQGIDTIHTKAVSSKQLTQLADLLEQAENYQDTLKQAEHLFNGLSALNTSLNVANQNPADPNTPLPSVSAYTKTIAEQSQQNAQKIHTLCAHLHAQGVDADLISECKEAAQANGNHAQNAVILNTVMNGTNADGLAQQVAKMSSVTAQFDHNTFVQFDQQFAALPTAAEGLRELNDGFKALHQAMPQLSSGSENLKTGMDQLAAKGEQLTALSAGVDQLKQGSVTLYDGSQQLYQGTALLSNSLLNANNGIQIMYRNTPILMNGIQQLNSASQTLADKTAQLDQGMQLFQSSGLDQLQAKIPAADIDRIIAIKDAMIQENEQVHSFSGAPENAESKVKFIYKTAEIKQPKKEVIKQEEPQEKQSFWEKVVDFFADLF